MTRYLKTSELIQIGRRALRVEAAALRVYSKQLGAEFVSAVELLCQPTGRIILTGIGKSGHVARKIAATLSSIGRPAMFVHPSEASHGDLGMIATGDVLLALSNSGESAELGDIIGYCEDHLIPIIALVGRSESTLARRARVALAYGSVQEVCAIGMAPTTSTTLAMAIGDSLAVGVMSVLGTTEEGFRKYHPGGKLGAALLRVKDLMHVGERIPYVHPSMPMNEVVLVISSKGFGVAIVRNDQGEITGIITDGDMRRHLDELWNLTAGELASTNPAVVAPELLAREAVEIMTRRGITSLIVRLDVPGEVGLLHIHDCLRAGL